MTYIARAAIFCDHCGRREECEPFLPSFLGMIDPDSTQLKGWKKIDGTHHLCPECSKAYRRKKQEFDDELKRFAGIRQVSFDL